MNMLKFEGYIQIHLSEEARWSDLDLSLPDPKVRERIDNRI